MAMEELQTRSELNQKLSSIRRTAQYIYYAVVVVLALINFWYILWAIPLWFVMAAVYTQIDNYYEAQYLNAILERKKQVQNKW